MAKVLIWLASGEKEKLMPGILYGTNAKKYNWLGDVKFVIFGESERLFVEDEELYNLLPEEVECAFCKFVLDQMGLTEKLKEKGAKVFYVGEYISKLIKDGYQVITF